MENFIRTIRSGRSSKNENYGRGKICGYRLSWNEWFWQFRHGIMIYPNLTLTVLLMRGFVDNFFMATAPVLQNYPPELQVTPGNPEFNRLYNLSKVPNLSVEQPFQNRGPIGCTATNANSCSWTCNNCLKPADKISCIDKNHWALTYGMNYTNV